MAANLINASPTKNLFVEMLTRNIPDCLPLTIGEACFEEVLSQAQDRQ